MSNVSAVLQATTGEKTVLERASARGRVDGLLFELTVEQHYRNQGSRNIEAVYTFPLPWGAVLLSLEFEIGGRKLSGVVVEKAGAERRYEEAIDAGDTAVLLERTDAGLYTVNVGNLLPGEAAIVRYRYAQLLRFEKGSVRLTIPTVVAPRYGNAMADAGFEAQQVPEVDLFAEYPFEIYIDLFGPIAEGKIGSPTHAVSMKRGGEGMSISLTRKGYLDRDFVLAIDGVEGQAMATVAMDGTGAVALASFCPSIPQTGKRKPRLLKILVDCSGSMAGDSIEAAKRALHEILASLEPQDEFSLGRFGSAMQQVTPGLVSATPKAIAQAGHAVMDLRADMGGTELETAMNATLKLDIGRHADVLLITDGQVWKSESIIQLARASDQRVFAVGIGAAPAETLLRSLAEETGGACELVGPKEDAESAITRMFLRLSQRAMAAVSVSWPVPPDWQLPVPTSVFDGETIHVMAGFAEPPQGAVGLSFSLAGTHVGYQSSVNLPAMVEVDALPRIAASKRLPLMELKDQGALAVQYQLVTDKTSCVLVHVRPGAEKPELLPETFKVKHMMAAGWGATGVAVRATASRYLASYAMDAMDLGSELDSGMALSRKSLDTDHTPREVLETLARGPLSILGATNLPTLLRELEGAGVVEWLVDALRDLVDEGVLEKDVVRAFLEAMVPIAEQIGIPRLAIRKLRHLFKDADELLELRTKVHTLLSSTTPDQWNSPH